MQKIIKINNYFGGYGVSNDGKVFTYKQGKNREVKQHDHKGYQRVFLFLGNQRKTYFVHRLVAEAFIKNKDDKEFVNHKDGNKRNNRVENLEWCTREENQRHSRDVLGNTNLGNRNGNHGYRKSRFYPSEALRSRLIELGIPRAKHDIVQLGEMLPMEYMSIKDGGDRWFGVKQGALWEFEMIKYPDPIVSNLEADCRAKILIYLLENKLITL
jgi:hypothetical protein